MKKKQIMYISILIILSTITEIQSIRHLTTEDINIIDTKLNDDIIKEDYTFDEKGEAYFSYGLSKFSSASNLVFNIQNSVEDELEEVINIECILSESTTPQDVVKDFESKDNICSSVHYALNKKVVVLTSLSGYKAGSLLYLKISSKKENTINIFIREKNNYNTKLEESQTIKDSFAYTAYEFDPEEYYEKKKEYLLSSSEANGLLICKKKSNELSLITETQLLAISEQSLAAHFWDAAKIIIFVGKRNYEDSETDNDLTVSLEEQTDKNTKLYYYTTSKFGGLTSFHYECKDDVMKHYLLVNYDNLEDDKYYYAIHNLVGSKSNSLAYLTEDSKDITNLDYSDAKKCNYLPNTEYHLQVFKLQCSGEGNKIIANIYYGKQYGNYDKGSILKTQFYDYPHKFEVPFTLSYGKTINEVGIEIFTPGTEEETKFKVFFEGKDYEVDNKNIYIFPVQNSESLTISSEDNIDAIISVSGIEKKEDSGDDDYLKMYMYGRDDIFYQYYKVNHDFNTNYYLDVEINNPNDDVIPLCYYLPNTEVFYKSAQNCILFPGKTTKNITIGTVFKESDDENDFNLEEPKYHFMIYNDDTSKYKITKIYLRTDLKKSIPIDKQVIEIYSELKYLEASLKKDEASYFNLNIPNTKEVNHMDLYILDDKPNNLKLDIKCIMKYEFAIKFIEPFFTDENDVCIVINKDEVNPNVYHILFNNVKKDANEIFIMKVIPNVDVDVKFLVKTNDYVSSYVFHWEQNIYHIKEPSIYSIFEVNREDFEKISSKNNMILYDKDENGIEFYARKDKEFIQIFKGSFNILQINEMLNKYKDYDKFVFVIGRYDCENKYCESLSKYQIKYLSNIEYINIPLEQFNGNYRIPLGKNDCKVDKPYYIILDYGQDLKKEEILLAKYDFTGYLNKAQFIDRFIEDDFEKVLINIDEKFSRIQENNHLSILKYTCKEPSVFVYFDYFSKTDNTEKTLKPASIHYFVLQNNTDYTFNYDKVEEIDFLILEGKEQPTFVFENSPKQMKSGYKTITLKRKDASINKFSVTTPAKADLPVRITTRYNINNLPKTEVNNLYKIDNTFIYDIPDFTVDVTFYITRKSRLRALEESGIKVCYNAGSVLLLDKNNLNCFYVDNEYQFKYIVPKDRKEGARSYVVIYPSDPNQQIDVKKVVPNIKRDGQSNSDEDGDEEGGSSWIIILVIILIVIIIIAVGIFIFIKIRKPKRVNSEDIEKDVKNTPSSMEIVN